jgi:diguanylate cyclase (GGDEF)-like protein
MTPGGDAVMDATQAAPDETPRHTGRDLSLLACAELLNRTGAIEIEWPRGEVKISGGLQVLLGLDDSSPSVAALDTLAWVHPDDRERVGAAWRAAAPGEPFELEHRVVRADGQCLHVAHRGALLGGPHGRTGVAVLQDITVQRRLQELARCDPITGLPNRARLLEHLDAALCAARGAGSQVALLAIHVAQVANLRATMGLYAADALACELATRLRQCCRDDGWVGQVADAEFAVVLQAGAWADPAVLRARATALLATLEAPVRLNTTDVFPRCTVGAARFPCDADHPATLLEAAQTARLEATADEGLALFRPEINQRAVRAMKVESALHRALSCSEFELHFQPQVDLLTGVIRGAEALLRWHSGELGPVAPSEFIPAAERSGLIGALSEWVLNTACRHIADWARRGLPRIRVAINLSPAELQRPRLAAEVQRMLVTHGVDPGWLSIELTEGMVMGDMEHAARVLQDLRALGIEIALDDFGTGFSSLSYLCRLPIDVLKIDRTFVHDVTAPPQELSVTRAIINMAHGLRMQVLAEGVETEGQLGLLASNGCDMVQGFFVSKALPGPAFEAMLTTWECLPVRFLSQRKKSRTLLLVDDEDNILSSLKRLFRRDGYRIVTASSGEEALRRLAEHEVDVIVSDQRMPGMTGVEFLNRARELYPQTVRMVLSGYTELQSIIDAVNEGAIYKFLTKPWDDDKLRGHVAEGFRQKELSDENRRLSRQVEEANADLASLNNRLEALLSRQREQAELLAASADSVRRLIEDLPAALVAVDPAGQIVLVNVEASERLPGAAGWIGRHVDEVWPASLAAAALGEQLPDAGVRLDGRDYTVMRRRLPVNSFAPCRVFLFMPRH